MFGISVFAGIGYVAWTATPLGKTSISAWLIKRWGELAEKFKQNFDKEKIKAELKKLKYDDHVLLWKITRLNLMLKALENKLDDETQKKWEKLEKELQSTDVAKRADLSALEGIVFETINSKI